MSHNLQHLLATILRNRGYSLDTKRFDGAWFNKQIPTVEGVVLDERRGLGTPRSPEPLRAIEWNGTNQYAWIPVDPVTEFPFTLFGWARKSDTTLETIVGISASSVSTKLFVVQADEGDRLAISRRNPTTVTTETSISPKTNTWSSFVISFTSNTTCQLFRDGELVANLSGLAAVNVDSSFNRVVIGATNSVSPEGYWTGPSMHCGFLRRAATLQDAQTFHATGEIPDAEVLLPLDGNSTTVAHNIGSSAAHWLDEPRRNLAQYTEDATRGDWSFVNASGTATQNGNDFTFGSSPIDRVFGTRVTIAPNTVMTASFTLSGSGQVRIFLVDGAGSVLSPGNITLTPTPTRYSVTFNLVNGGSSARGAVYNNSQGNPSSFTIHNHQFELGSTATEYQPVLRTGIDYPEATIVNGAAGMLYTGRDVPFSRHNKVGFSTRRNLFNFTEQLTNAYWIKSRCTLDIATLIAPNGVIAHTLRDTAENGTHRIFHNPEISGTTGQFYTGFCVAKAGTSSRFELSIQRSNETSIGVTASVFDLSSGTVVSGPGTIESLGNGWFKCSTSGQINDTLLIRLFVFMYNSSNVRTYVGDTTNTINIGGLQFELGSVATPYQRIGADPGADIRFPALLSDPTKSAATDPLTFSGEVPRNGQLEQANCFTFDSSDDRVAVDLSQWAGPEIILNGGFDDATNWVPTNGGAISGGKLVSTAIAAGTIIATNTGTVVAGQTYLVTYTVSDRSGGAFSVGIGAVTTWGTVRNANGTYTEVLTAPINGAVTIFTRTSATTGTIDNISVRELPTGALGPELVVNGGFDTDTVWTKGTGWTISGGVASRSNLGSSSSITQTETLVPGRTYVLTYTLTQTSGNFNTALQGGTSVFGPNRTTSGTYTEYLTAVSGNNALGFVGGSTFAGSIDNVSLRDAGLIPHDGTSLLTYRSQGDGFTGTAGTAFNIRIGDVEHIPCSEGAGNKLHGTKLNQDYLVVNGQAGNWTANKQNVYHYNVSQGMTKFPATKFEEVMRILAPYSPRLAMNFMDPADSLWTDASRTVPTLAVGERIRSVTNQVTGQPHGAATSDAKSPLWARYPETGRRNLLLRTEEFDNAVWSKTRATVALNATTSLEGTLTADKLIESADNNDHFILQTVTTTAAVHVFSVRAKASERSWVVVGFNGNANAAWFNLSTGTIGTVTGTGSATIAALGDGWYQCTYTRTLPAGVNIPIIWPAIADNSVVYAGDGTSGIFIDKAQLELGSTVTNYQRVVTAADITEAGVPDVYGALFDGNDDCVQVANFDLSNTDEVCVIAGVRKLSDAARGMVIEFTSTFSNPGSFQLNAPADSTGDPTYLFGTGGSAGSGPSSNKYNNASITAPVTNVLACVGKISTDTNKLYVNGVSVSSSSVDQGTGNYANSTLNIGGRNNAASLPFNGYVNYLFICGLIPPDAVLTQAYNLLGTEIGLTPPSPASPGVGYIPASQTNPGFDVLGSPLTNPPVVGLNGAESRINFSPVANSWPTGISIPGADIPTYEFDGNPGDIEVRIDTPTREAKFILEKE